MFRTVNDQPTLWDAILPPEMLVLPVELGRVDGLLAQLGSTGRGEVAATELIAIRFDDGDTGYARGHVQVDDCYRRRFTRRAGCSVGCLFQQQAIQQRDNFLVRHN